MAQIHDVGRLYVSHMNYLTRKGMPLIEKRQWTAELQEPWRIGVCTVVRIPFTKLGLVVGWWGPPGIELETLRRAIGYRALETPPC